MPFYFRNVIRSGVTSIRYLTLMEEYLDGQSWKTLGTGAVVRQRGEVVVTRSQGPWDGG